MNYQRIRRKEFEESTSSLKVVCSLNDIINKYIIVVSVSDGAGDSTPLFSTLAIINDKSKLTIDEVEDIADEFISKYFNFSIKDMKETSD